MRVLPRASPSALLAALPVSAGTGNKFKSTRTRGGQGALVTLGYSMSFTAAQQQLETKALGRPVGASLKTSVA